MDNTDVFTSEEIIELADVQRIRKSLIEKLTEEGVPDKGSKQVLLLGLLDGSDRSALSRAKLRVDKKRDDNMQNTVRVVGDVLKTINARTYRPPAAPEDRTIPPELEHRTFVPGELDIGIEPITITQLIVSN